MEGLREAVREDNVSLPAGGNEVGKVGDASHGKKGRMDQSEIVRQL